MGFESVRPIGSMYHSIFTRRHGWIHVLKPQHKNRSGSATSTFDHPDKNLERCENKREADIGGWWL
jgi:hypothetical protein